jgi:preprotein translocase subunit SecD
MVSRDAVGHWNVTLTLTRHGSSAWDRLSRSSFHEYVGVDLDGHVLEAPLIEPSQGAWSSFSGQLELTGPKPLDVVLAFELRAGALPVETKLISVRPSVRA